VKAVRHLEVLGRLGRQVLLDSTAEVATSAIQQEGEHHRDTLWGRLHLLGMDSRYQEGEGPTNGREQVS
jgi:hypothetical protein